MKKLQGIVAGEDGGYISCGLLWFACKLCYLDMYLHTVNLHLLRFPLLWLCKTRCITYTNLTILSTQTFLVINRNLWNIFTTCLQKFCGPPLWCTSIEGAIHAGKFLFGRCNGKRPFRRPGHTWENITKDVIEIGVKMRIVLQTRCH
jgi:hypothetical protein